MTRLASLLSGVCEVINALAVRAEDVIGEWVDNWGPRPEARRDSRAVALLARWNDDDLIQWEGGDVGRWVIGIPNDKLAEEQRGTERAQRRIAQANLDRILEGAGEKAVG